MLFCFEIIICNRTLLIIEILIYIKKIMLITKTLVNMKITLK